MTKAAIVASALILECTPAPYSPYSKPRPVVGACAQRRSSSSITKARKTLNTFVNSHVFNYSRPGWKAKGTFKRAFWEGRGNPKLWYSPL